MTAAGEVVFELRDDTGQRQGELRISLIPGHNYGGAAAIVDERNNVDADHELEPVQILEAAEYHYAFVDAHTRSRRWDTDRRETFQRDGESGLSGRLRPGNYTGRLAVEITADGNTVGRIALEVRSRKLDYVQHYRWMLRDLAALATELLMERFAPTEQRYSPGAHEDAETLYQRFAFLKSLLTDEGFRAALQQILLRPHVAWVRREEDKPPGRGMRGGSSALRQLTRAGSRVPWPDTPYPQLLPSVPTTLRIARTEEVLDNVPNRFVRFALLRWRNEAALLRDALTVLAPSISRTRGEKEIELLLDELDALLSHELFREVESLSHIPSDNQVLLRREGYRDVYQAYLQFDLAAQLAWSGGERVYGAGQRNVATLYEYWTFVTLAQIVARICGSDFELSKMLRVTEAGISLDLIQGRKKVLAGVVQRLGRQVIVELWFNRTFGVAETGSWTRPMRPDMSLRCRASDPLADASGEVWLHFDAKYRIDTLTQAFGIGEADVDPEAAAMQLDEQEEKGAAQRTDLLKMHAYRDAIRRSAGAYVLYPGTEHENRQEYHEILPGLGAFPLRPSQTGDAQGVTALENFLDEVLVHIASQATGHERGRYWWHRAWKAAPAERTTVPAVDFLSAPPADTVVLLGFVRSREHFDWIRRTGRYNLRAGDRTGAVQVHGRELAAELVVLYGPPLQSPRVWRIEGEPQILTREQLIKEGYPAPRGKAYFCFRIAPFFSAGLAEASAIISEAHILAVRRRVAPAARWGQPLAISWAELLLSPMKT